MNPFILIFLLARKAKPPLVSLSIGILRPLLYLWPWLCGLIAYWLFLTSPQGVALASGNEDPSLLNPRVFGTILVTGLFVLVSTLLGQIAESISRGAPFNLLEAAVAALWVVGLSPGYGLLFALKTGSSGAWIATGILSVIVLSGWLWFGLTAGKNRSLARATVAFLGRHRLLLTLTTTLFTIGPIAWGASYITAHPMRSSELGPLLIAMLGFGLTSTLFGAVLVVVPLILRLPWLGAALLVAMMAWTFALPLAVDGANPLLLQESRVAYRAQSEGSACAAFPSTVIEAIQERIQQAAPGRGDFANLDLSPDQELYLVSAEGGGIRAAYWTALALGQLDAGFGDRFSRQVATLSGVSGGSLGIATWLAVRERQDLSPQSRLDIMTSYLGSDFLSPFLGGLFFLDAPRLLFGPFWFNARRDQVFEKALSDQWRKVGGTDFFARPFFHLCLRGFDRAPAIYFNATEANTGRYIPMSATLLPGTRESGDILTAHLRETTLAWASVAQMVHISARFPYLSPPAEVGLEASALADEADGRSEARKPDGGSSVNHSSILNEKYWEGPISRVGVLVDGGYFDNTGLMPTRMAIDYIASKKKSEQKTKNEASRRFMRTQVNVVHIENDLANVCLPARMQSMTPRAQKFADAAGLRVICDYQRAVLEDSFESHPFGWFLAPLNGLTSVRSVHSRAERDKLVDELVSASKYSLNSMIRVISLADAIEGAYGSSVTVWPNADAQALYVFGKIVEEWQAGYLSNDALEAWAKELDKWRERIKDAEQQADCFHQNKPIAPPLGWTLTRSNTSLLKCLAIRSVITSGLAPLPIPSFTFPPNDINRPKEK